MKTIITIKDIRNVICRTNGEIRQYEFWQPGTWDNADFRPLEESSAVEDLLRGAKVIE